MKKLLMVLPLVFLLCFTFGCQQGEEVAEEPVVDVEADIQAIKDIVEEWAVAFNAADIDRLMSLYTTDAVRIPPNLPSLNGKEAIRSDFQQNFDQYTYEEDDVVLDVSVSGDLAFTHVTWSSIVTPKATGESLKLNGNWIIILKKQPDGTWGFIYEIWSNESLISPTQSEE